MCGHKESAGVHKYRSTGIRVDETFRFSVCRVGPASTTLKSLRDILILNSGSGPRPWTIAPLY